MSLTSVVLFSLAVLPFAKVYGQTFCTGSVLPCVQNAVCNATTDSCECAPNFFGDGRIACRNNTRCVCTALADPIISLFDTQASTQTVKANLPCSVKLVDQSFVLGSPNCVINQILAHPETRGSGTASNLRVFVKELQVELILPGISFILDASGTTVVSGAATVNTALSSDNFLTATLPDCSSLQVGYNSTYAGAYIDTAAATYTTTGMCGDCDNTNDENAGSTNVTNFAYFLKFLVPTADQKGSYVSECGQLETIITSTCSVGELDLVAEVYLPYMSDFGLCLIDDASW